MAVIIDGHNLLRSIQKTSEDFESLNDIGLSHIIGRYLKLVGEKGEIVFDGSGPRDKGRFDNIENLEVVFSGAGSDADSVIENEIRANTGPRSLTVVSSDRRLRKASRARKARSVKSEAFWTTVQRRLRGGKRVEEPAAKRLGLSEGETEQWLKFFEFEQ